jgi:hypothetical protein
VAATHFPEALQKNTGLNAQHPRDNRFWKMGHRDKPGDDG